MSGVLAPWRSRTALRRSGTQWRLLVVVAAVAVLVGSLLSSLTVLLVATERQGVRGALTAAEPRATQVQVTAVGLTRTPQDVRTAADAAVADLLGPAPVSGTGSEQSVLQRIDRADDIPALTYLGHVEGLDRVTTLESGSWPTSTVSGDAIPVAVPAVLAEAFDLSVGSRLTIGSLTSLRETATVEVVGTFSVLTDEDPFWGPDELGGLEHDPEYSVPGTGGSLVTDAYGPVVVAPGALAAHAIEVDRLTVRYLPDFARASAADVVPLLDRLERAEQRGAAAVGDVADAVRLTTRLAATAQEVATALVVTRASVLVVGLLLVLLAAAALLQTARLLTDARLGEQNLMRARGASGRQLVGLAATEALGLGLLTAGLSPLLARQVYLVVAETPAMVAAGMSFDPGFPPAAWITAVAAALLFAVVLVSPLLRRAGTFVEGEQARARPDRRAMLTRSGLDVVLVVLAAVAYDQLRSYRSPVSRGGASLAVDPVLVAGPAIVLLAGALLCVRLLPAASRLAEVVGARGRGVVGPLAAWEVGRRSSRATAAVLLLTLALATGTFSQSFLATWRQSQADQAQFATGAAVRFDDTGSATQQLAALAGPGAGPAEPAVVRPAELASATAATFGRAPEGRPVELLALTDASRRSLTAGRLAEEGGAELAALGTIAGPGTGVVLDGDLRGLSAVLQVGSPVRPSSAVAAIVRLVLADATGLISTIDLGTTRADGVPRQVDVLLPGTLLEPEPGTDEDDAPADAATTQPPATRPAHGLQLPLTVVGLQATVFVADLDLVITQDGDEFDVPLVLAQVAALHPADADADPSAADGTTLPGATLPNEDGTAVEVDRRSRVLDLAALGLVRTTADPDEPLSWNAMSRGAQLLVSRHPQDALTGVRVAGRLSGLAGGIATVAQVGWTPEERVPAVLSGRLATRLAVEPGASLLLVLDGSIVPVVVSDVVRHVPTLPRQDAVVVDHDHLARALVQAGAAGSAVDEWWVDVAPADVEEYLAALPVDAVGASPADTAQVLTRETAAMQEHPLRVATQGALWLVTLSAALLAAVGFAVHATVSLRARSVEFAQLRAIGLSRRRLTAVVGLESFLLCTLGAVFGIGLGALLGWLVGPLVAVSATGTTPVPVVLVTIPWGQVALLAVEVVAVLALVVLVVARTQRSADPASVMREGEER